MAYAKIKAIDGIRFDTNGIAPGTWVAMNGPHGIGVACSMLRIVNASTVPVMISYDGVTMHDYVFANSVLEIFDTNNDAQFQERTIVSVDGAAAGVGFIYVFGYYQK